MFWPKGLAFRGEAKAARAAARVDTGAPDTGAGGADLRGRSRFQGSRRLAAFGGAQLLVGCFFISGHLWVLSHARLLRSPPRSPCQSPARFARPQRGSCEAAAEPLRGPMQGSMRGSCEAPLRSPCESPAKSATPQRGSCEAAVRRAGTLRISRTSVGFSRTSWTSANSADPSGISREFFADLARMHRGSLAEASWTPCEPRRSLADFADFGAVSYRNRCSSCLL